MTASSVFGALSYDGTVVMTDPVPGSGSYHAVTSTLGSFDTFCLESSEYFNPGGTYSYIVNSGAVEGGGIGHGANAIDTHTLLPMDNVSIGTAYLYSQFHAGNYQNASLMHDAIWYLEGEGGSANAYVSAAETALHLTEAQIMEDQGSTIGVNTYSYNVVALNLYGVQIGNNGVTVDGGVVYRNQDMLAIVPEPTTMIAGALLLLPFGASTLRVLRRKA
jgi:hypothetical protein